MDITYVLLLTIAFYSVEGFSSALPEKVCRGTTSGFQDLDSQEYTFYKNRYTNCTVIDGNLELTYIADRSNPDPDMTFLSSIREVTGYVLVATSTFSVLPLTNLILIRGEGDLLLGKHSLVFYRNWYPSYGQDVGLKRVHMPNLRAISRGGVRVFTTPLLCFMGDIDWTRIVSGGDVKVTDETPSRPVVYCPICRRDICSNCWDSGKENCQAKDAFNSCHQSCTNGCFAEGEGGCCDKGCAAGCTGPANNQCMGQLCRNIEDDGACVSSCPAHKYLQDKKCVVECPDFLVKDGKTCATKCPVGQDDFLGQCLECGAYCKKRCSGLPRNEFLDVSNIDQFKGCEIVEGSIHIPRTSFLGDNYYNRPGLTREQLLFLSSVREITGHLFVSATGVSASSLPVDDLSFLQNLEVIHGRQLTVRGSSLVVANTPFRSLGLRSLRRIGHGIVAIHDNPNLRLHMRRFRRILGRSATLRLTGNHPAIPAIGSTGTQGK